MTYSVNDEDIGAGQANFRISSSCSELGIGSVILVIFEGSDRYSQPFRDQLEPVAFGSIRGSIHYAAGRITKQLPDYRFWIVNYVGAVRLLSVANYAQTEWTQVERLFETGILTAPSFAGDTLRP
ncbi:hypothetical protein AH67_05155 [Bifidobacterium pseudolongum PV8-2]|uniref:Uncharacterized protein n=1 Tax=Bifidobacterium pseudolongum PV8-2 TaxID=1447715 RepID=A0A0A7ICV8_9BIFI|nr:hypothetical protein AH67_05155 [Bifidobacterium pseudolongum PV8-2]